MICIDSKVQLLYKTPRNSPLIHMSIKSLQCWTKNLCLWLSGLFCFGEKLCESLILCDWFPPKKLSQYATSTRNLLHERKTKKLLVKFLCKKLLPFWNLRFAEMPNEFSSGFPSVSQLHRFLRIVLSLVFSDFYY